MRSHRQLTYCLYVSKRHMMLEVFTDSSKSFYKFGDLIFLNKIETLYLVDFINERFVSTNKDIDDFVCRSIVALSRRLSVNLYFSSMHFTDSDCCCRLWQCLHLYLREPSVWRPSLTHCCPQYQLLIVVYHLIWYIPISQFRFFFIYLH